MDKRIACMATIPGREDRAIKSIASIAAQVDEVHVVLNYGDVDMPEWTQGASSSVSFYIADNSRGDAEKFRMSDGSRKGYIFTCDDDIEYSDGYVGYMIKAVEKYKRKNPIGLFGARVKPGMTDYYANRQQIGRLHNAKLKVDTWAHVTGTNTLCYHTDTLPVIPMDIFTRPNMADIFFGAWCNNQGRRIIIMPHNGRLIRDMAKGDDTSIYATRAKHGHIQAQECNRVVWR